MNNTYDINSIESLDFRTGVRTRINMYLGSDDIEGTYQALKEIINNSTDEALASYGNEIEIHISEKENTAAVIDYGRGIPFGLRDDGENVLVSIFSKSHTGGKFDEGAYKNASGLNGIGAKCTCLSSEKFEVQSIRDGKMATAYFEKGNLISYNEAVASPNKHGTYIRFKPDTEVFKNGDIGYSYQRVCTDIKNISYLYNTITFKVINDDTNETNIYHAENGIIDFITEKVTKPVHSHIIYSTAQDSNGDKIEIAFQWGANKEQSYVFVNGLLCPEGGTPITGAKTALTRTINSLTKLNLDGDLIRRGLFYVMNCSVAQPSFANQTKSKINNANLKTLASNAFTSGLKEMNKKYASEFNDVINLIKTVEKSEEAATKAREAILNHEKKEQNYKKQKITSSDKFKDCEQHGDNSILIICEGNSALGGLLPARNVVNEALYAVRGKVINLMKHSLEECLENQEVSDIILALGCGIQDKYNSKKLNYGKVAIATDGDADGYNIMCLIATMFYELMPKFIEEGRLCWLRAPLYRLTKGNKRIFAYDDNELTQLKKKYSDWEQGRQKGLGEMTAEDMEASMLHPTERRLEVLTIHDAELAKQSLQMLMGEEVDARKKFLFDNVDFSILNR